MPTDAELRRAGREDRRFVETILGANDLPVADLSEALDCLFVCETGDERIGVGGLQRCGDVGLLRSVVIEESVRGTGYGTQVCTELLDRARAADVVEVYLLTTTAEEFFARLGFERIDRETVPESIRETSEFSDLCPLTAACMKRELHASDADGAPME